MQSVELGHKPGVRGKMTGNDIDEDGTRLRSAEDSTLLENE